MQALLVSLVYRLKQCSRRWSIANAFIGAVFFCHPCMNTFLFDMMFYCVVIQALSKKQEGFYQSAKTFGFVAIILDIICVMWTLLLALLIIGLILGLAY